MISIIIPTLNEERALPQCLHSNAMKSDEIEIIVVDGGSSDRTVEIVKKHRGIRLLASERGRAAQMNAGAEIAGAEWLLFLHADTLLPDNAIQKIKSLTTDEDIKAGCFHHRFSDDHFLLRIISWLHNWRFKQTHIIYGDQCMFIRNTLFKELGAFPNVEILEDIIFSEKLKKLTTPILLDEAVVTDSRKFIQRGILRSFFDVLLIISCYELKISIMSRSFFADIR